jgi:hypothetical protein
MTTEEEHNIDDLVDYKDFESGLESHSDGDSFNDDIMKLYEDHKKKGAGDKTSEVQNAQRPMSKYQRNVVSGGRREDESNQTNLNSERYLNTNQDFPNIETENFVQITSNSQLNLENLFKRFNKHLQKYKISCPEFIDNPKIYFSRDEFNDLFKKIKFEISRDELNYLFEGNEDGYLKGLNFLKNFSNKIFWADGKDKKKNVNFSPEHTERARKVLDEKIELNCNVNEEFKLMKNEIMEIVNQESRPKSTAKIPKRPVLSSIHQRGTSKNKIINLVSPEHKNSDLKNPDLKIIVESKNSTNILQKLSNKIDSGISRPKTSFNETSKYTGNKSSNVSTISKKPRDNSHKYLQQTLLKKKAEEEMVRLALERKNKEIERDCIQKMSQANIYAEELGIPKSYSAYKDDVDDTILCRILDKNNKRTVDVELKQFLLEWKKLHKLHRVS